MADKHFEVELPEEVLAGFGWREIATAQGLEVVGILRIFADAKQRGLIPEARPLVAALLTIGYWMDAEGVIRPFLEEMGEAAQREA